VNYTNRSARTGLAICGALLLSILSGAPRVCAQEGPSDGIFVSVHNPITSEVTSRVKEITTRAAQRFEADRAAAPGEARTFRIVLDFTPGTRTGQATPVGSREFGPCQDLAEHLLHLQNVTTIAYLRAEVSRHTVLPVLACKDIVMADDAALGDVLRDQTEPLSRSRREAYREVIQGRSPAIVMKMLDPDMVVLKGRTIQGADRYIDAREEQAEAKNGVIVVDHTPVVAGGPKSMLYTAKQASDFGLSQPFFIQTRQQLAVKYQLPASSLREDPLLGRTPVPWRIELKGPVNAALSETLRRRTKRVIGQGANLIILQLDCSGGDPTEAQELAEYFRDLKDDRGELPVMTVAYVPHQAPDTATVLAMGCTEIVMHKDAELGDFSQFVYERRDGREVEIDRDHTRLRIQALSAFAEEQGYPPLLIRGMLDPHVTIYWASNLKDGRERRFLTEEELNEDKKRVQPIWGRERLVKAGGNDGKLLTLPAEGRDGDPRFSAKELGIIRHTVDGVNDVYALYGLSPNQVHVAGPDWLDGLALFLRSTTMSIILVLVGVTCLILELKMPGVGVPGVIAAICFVLFFWSHSQLAGQITMLAVLLFVLGLILLALEVFVLPGFGVAGVSGILLVLVSLALVTLEKKPETTQEWLSLLGTVGTFALTLFAAVPIAIAVAWYLPSLPYMNRIILKPEAERAEETGEPPPYVVRPEIAALLGAIGMAVTPLRPAGKVQFGEEYVDVVAESGYVVPGTRVQVIEIEGNRIVVKEVSESFREA
jgi:membrane-bound ClpP family serine protease